MRIFLKFRFFFPVCTKHDIFEKYNMFGPKGQFKKIRDEFSTRFNYISRTGGVNDIINVTCMYNVFLNDIITSTYKKGFFTRQEFFDNYRTGGF